MKRMLLALSLISAMHAGLQKPEEPLRFSVVSVKASGPAEPFGAVKTPPDGLSAKGIPMAYLIALAYGLPKDDRVLGLNESARKARFDVEARVEDTDLPRWKQLTYGQKTAMLQSVLQERCHLISHLEQRELAELALIISRGGVKAGAFKPSADKSEKGSWNYFDSRTVAFHNFSLEEFCQQFLPAEVQEVIVNRTGLEGRFDFQLQWDEEMSPDGRYSIIADALRGQLGLQLSQVKSMKQVVVVESLTAPEKN